MPESKVAMWTAFMGKTQGRDKVTRVVQYLARFLAGYCAQHAYGKDTVAMFASIKSTFGNARKVFRLGRSVDFVQSGAKAQASPSPLVRVGFALKYGALALWMLLDNALLLNRLKVLRLSAAAAETMQRRAFKLWLVGLAASVATQLAWLQFMFQRLCEHQQDARRVGQLLVGSSSADPASAELRSELGASRAAQRSSEREMRRTALLLLQDVLDCAIPATALGYTGLQDHTVGLIGTVTGLMGARTVWNSVNGAPVKK